MPRIYEHEDGFRFEDGDLDILLDDDAIFANVHVREPMYDRVAVLDPRDDMYFQWWKVDSEPEIYEQMLFVASSVGSVLLRQVAGDGVKELFDNAHQLTETDVEHLLDEAA
jgi:hypothetical protein